MKELKKVEYKNCFVFFIDILGFKELIKKNNAAEIRDIIEYFYKIFESDFSKPPYQNYNITQVSDCIVISFEKEPKFQLYMLLHIFFDLQSALLADKGVLIRGAGRFGKLYHDDKYLFGEAYQNAFYSEEKTAIYPRIIIPQDVFNQFTETEKDHCNELLKKDADGMYYLDYINIDITDISNNKKEEYRTKIKQRISDGIEKYKNNPDILIKYKWLETKFNEYINIH